MKLTLNEVVEIFNELKQIENLECGHVFAYAAMRNYKLCEIETEILDKFAKKPIEGADEYQNGRNELALKYAKHKNGKPITETDSNGIQKYTFESDENKQKYLDEMNKLNEEHSKYFDSVNKRRNDIEEMLKQEVEIDFLQVPLDAFPDKITPRQLRILEFMIE